MWGRHTQRQCLKCQNPLAKKLQIFGKSWGTFKLSCKKGCMMDVVLLRDLCSTFKTNLSLQEYQEDEWKSLIKAQ